MKTRKWAVEPHRTVGSIVEFVKKYLKMDAKDSLVGSLLYIYLLYFFSELVVTMMLIA